MPRRQAPWILLGVVAVLAASGAGLIYLPYLLVDRSSFVDQAGVVDARGIQDAYNAARIPVGVALAACVAAIATAAGVFVNSRSVAVARMAIDDGRLREEESRRRWEEEQRQASFAAAAGQLGNDSPAVRLAGVYALCRLADGWETERARAVQVLCAYLRMPTNIADRAEQTVRRAISDQILAHITDGRQNGWSQEHLDLSGAVLEEFFHAGPATIHSLDLSRATLVGFSGFDHLLIANHLSANGLVVDRSFRVSATLGVGATLWLQELSIEPEADVVIAVRQSLEASLKLPGFVRLNVNNLSIRGGSLTVSLRGVFGEQAVFGSPVSVQSGKLTFLMSEGSPSAATIRLQQVHVGRAGHIEAGPLLHDAIECHYEVVPLNAEQAAQYFDPDPNEVSYVTEDHGS